MKKTHCRQNRKGSVLLTVICFTMVCILLATAALNDARTSGIQSNASVRKTQAQVTAEDYLKEYLNNYGGNYNALSTLAGADVSHPKEVEVQLQDNSGNVIDTNGAGGSCKIYIYKSSSSGIVVKSQVNYAGEVETSSAYFDAPTSTVSSPYDSTSAIETIDGSVLAGVANQAISISGDTIFESGSANDLIKFGNGKNPQKGTLYVDSNILCAINSGDKFVDTDGGKPSNVISNGYIFWKIADFTTTVGKYDINFKRDGETGFDANNLSNRDGYILTDKKFINLASGTSCSIGSAGKPIDVYCRGAYFGKIPTTVADYSAITSIYNDSTMNQTNPGAVITGNLYCYKGTSTTYQNGDLYINMDNCKVDGDVIVDGDIYLSKNFTITGKLYCTGNIYKESGGNYTAYSAKIVNDLDGSGNIQYNGDGTIKTKLEGDAEVSAMLSVGSSLAATTSKMSATLPTSSNTYDRCNMPRIKYDPARFDPTHIDSATGLQDRLDPDRKSPKTIYTGKTANDMFRDNTAASKNIQTKYSNAYASTQDSASLEMNTFVNDGGTIKSLQDVLSGMTDTNAIKNKMNSYDHLYVKSSYRYNKTLLSNYYWDTNTIKKITVMMPDSDNDSDDIVFILPAFTGTGDNSQFPEIVVDNSGISDAHRQIANPEKPYDAVSNPKVPKIFCYFMRDCGEVNPSTNEYMSGTASEWNLSTIKITDEQHTNPDTDFKDIVIKGNNIFILVPDECTLRIKGQNSKCIQAIVYATGAYVELTPTGSGKAPVCGQLLTKKFNLLQDGANVSRFLPANGSILEFINSGSTPPTPATVSLKYFIANKD